MMNWIWFFVKLWEEEELHDGAVEDLVDVRLSSETQE